MPAPRRAPERARRSLRFISCPISHLVPDLVPDLVPGASQASLYERLGGRPAIERIVARFYAGVAGDPVLRPLYPDDLQGAQARLGLFLVQYTGGPADYEARRGPAKLRLRHLDFAIGKPEHDAWLTLMSSAVAAEGLEADVEGELISKLEATAKLMVNRGGLTLRG